MVDLIKILDENNWDNLAIEVIDSELVTKEIFDTEYAFIEFVKENMTKYESDLREYREVYDENTKKRTLVFTFGYKSNHKVLTSEYIKGLGDDIMIDLSKEDIEQIKEVEESIREKFLKVLTINTDGVKAKFYPFDDSHTLLREDDEYHTADQKEVLENAPTTNGEYVTIVKVVK